MIKKTMANRSLITSLPKLKALREQYCSQVSLESAIKYITASMPDRILCALEEETDISSDNHHRAYSNIVSDMLCDGNFTIFKDWMSYVDFSFELRRRIRNLKGYRDILPEGVSMSENLCNEVSGLMLGTLHKKHKEVIKLFFIEHKDMCLFASEMLRHGDRIYSLETEIIELIKVLYYREFEEELAFAELTKIKNEIFFILGCICDIPMYLKLKESRNG